MSSIPQNKDELLHAIQDGYQKILGDYQRVPDALVRTPGVEGNVKGTLISVSDTLGYLIGWGRLLIKWIDARNKGEHIDLPETGYKWNQLGQLAEKFHRDYDDWEYHALLDEYEIVIQELTEIIRNTSNQSLYVELWYEKWTLGRMIQFNTSSPMKNMRTKVRRFLKAQSLVQS
ncbi:ClbS/DfsB family four-helix bundle protein [Pseudoteredinibacter isoporae]|uniref:ClbS/DfsB family four-helix bundle protein n=1 Tax=Pseudoteredinibacter isoporae TaxID=570281 RepID=UPI0033417778